ncbi:MAG: cation:proton antiporter [Desulfurivibrionaceae bacterium]
MDGVTFALALILGMGFVASKLAQLLRLPSVTGYILAGIALGPSGLNLITQGMVEDELSHFIQIALMLIAFGIGEHLELNKLRHTIKSVGLISFCESSATLLLVTAGIFLTLLLIGPPQAVWNLTDYIYVSLLLGAVSIATAPASTLHVIREIRASGPMTTTLLQVVVVNNSLAIIVFGVVVSLVDKLISGGTDLGIPLLVTIVSGSLANVLVSLFMGVITGLLIDFTINRLKYRSEILIAGLSLLLLCGETARALEYSPLLAGIAAGFIIVNRNLRDVRLFRVLNYFEPPIYVLFFALAGAHLDLTLFSTAGLLGFSYFLFRAAGKYMGARLGSSLTASSHAIRNNIGLALIPQAGIAIGLVFLMQNFSNLQAYVSTITTVVLAGVFLSELIGPVLAKCAMEAVGEAVALRDEVQRPPSRDICPLPWKKEEFQLVPWTWERLEQARNPSGEVLFGLSHMKTTGGLTRIATILAHHARAIPVAVRVNPYDPSVNQLEHLEESQNLFRGAIDEAFSMGYRLETLTVHSHDIAEGILEAAALADTRMILLGHPKTQPTKRLQYVVDKVAARATCPVVVVRFAGVLHTERIIVPLTGIEELENLQDVISSLAAIGRHKITFFYLMPPETPENEQEEAKKQLLTWAEEELSTAVQAKIAATEARLASIAEEAEYYDLVVMDATPVHGLKRIFFGSLAENVAQQCDKNILMVHRRKKSQG